MARRKDDWGWRRPPPNRPLQREEEEPHYEVRGPDDKASQPPPERQRQPAAAQAPPRPEPAPPPKAPVGPEAEPEEERVGPRRAALQERRRKQRRGRMTSFMTTVLVLGIAAGGAIYLTTDKDEEPKEEDSVRVPVAAGDPIEQAETTLLFGTKESPNDDGAMWIVVMSYDPTREAGSVIYVPAHTAVEVPGRGLQGVGQAYASGGIPLLLVSVENLLGIHMDHYVELSDKDAQVLFASVGPLSVDVPEDIKVPAGKNQARLLIPAGNQRLSPEFMARFLYTRGLDGDDVSLGLRQIAFWDAFFQQFHADPGTLGKAIERGAAALGESDGDVTDHQRLLSELAGLSLSDRIITTIPVTPVSAGGENQLYQADADELASFVSGTMTAPQGQAQEIRVQVLNGNGVPGIGQEVAERLIGQGFRVILSGNARRLNYKKTLIITYASTPDQIELARRAKDLLGVGEVQVSAQQQGIVDLTIVVGKDFLRT